MNLVVKGNRVFGLTGRQSQDCRDGQIWNPFERKRRGQGIPNPNMDEHWQ
jgi:hypothetical protein